MKRQIILLCLLLAYSAPAYGGNLAPKDGPTVMKTDQANTVTTGAQDFSAATSLKMPIAAGCTAGSNGLICYDPTTDMWHLGTGAADAKVAVFTVTPSNGDCAKWTVSGSNAKLDTTGAPCGAGGGGTGVGRTTLSSTFTAIVDGGCQDQTAPWTGITTADTITLGLPSNFTVGLTANPIVSAADTVKVRLCNFTGSSNTPGTLSFKATLAVYNLSGSSSLTFASITDGTCGEQTFPLTGASAGDPVVEKWPSSLETGLHGNMFASASNTIKVRLCNDSGSALTPAVQTFGASIAK